MADCRLRRMDSTVACVSRLAAESIFHFSMRVLPRSLSMLCAVCCTWRQDRVQFTDRRIGDRRRGVGGLGLRASHRKADDCQRTSHAQAEKGVESF